MEGYKVGSEDRLVQKFELKNGFGGVNYQIHQKATNMRHQTNESDEDDFDQPQRNHGQTDHGIKEINLYKVIGKIMAGDFLKICGTHQKTTLGGFVSFLCSCESFSFVSIPSFQHVTKCTLHRHCTLTSFLPCLLSFSVCPQTDTAQLYNTQSDFCMRIK